MSKFDQDCSSGVKISEVRIEGGESYGIQVTSTSIVNTTLGDIKLSNVKYVPTMKKNLILVASITDPDHIVVFSNTHCYVFHKGKVIAFDHRDFSNGLYVFGIDFLDYHNHHAHIVEDHSYLLMLWHCHLRHLSFRAINYLHESQA